MVVQNSKCKSNSILLNVANSDNTLMTEIMKQGRGERLLFPVAAPLHFLPKTNTLCILFGDTQGISA